MKTAKQHRHTNQTQQNKKHNNKLATQKHPQTTTTTTESESEWAWAMRIKKVITTYILFILRLVYTIS